MSRPDSITVQLGTTWTVRFDINDALIGVTHHAAIRPQAGHDEENSWASSSQVTASQPLFVSHKTPELSETNLRAFRAVASTALA